MKVSVFGKVWEFGESRCGWENKKGRRWREGKKGEGIYHNMCLFCIQAWFEKTPLGKKRKKAAEGDDGDTAAKGKKGKGKKK